jgi:cobalt-zinc-cadmium efflux system protein
VAVEKFLASLPGVVSVHDLHIWGLSTTHVALTAHLVKPDPGQEDDLLTHACRELHARFHIEHAMLQIESGRGAHPCSPASADII